MLDEAVGVGQLGGGHALFIGGGQAAVADVLHNGAGEQVGILQHDAKRGTQRVLFDGLDVVAVVEDLTLLDVVEAVDQVGDGGLTGAGRTDESDLLARTAIEVDVVQDDFALIVAEVHILKDDVALQLGVSDSAIGVLLFPGPDAGGLVGLGQGVVGLELGMHQGDVALVDLGLFIQQGEDTGAASQSHDDCVQLHGDLSDGLVEALIKGQEAGQLAQRQAADAADGQRTADHSAEHIAQVAQLAVDGHRHQRVGVGLVGAVEQLIVEFVELLDGGILVAENLDDLLAVHHFLDVAVDFAQLLLLLEEVLAGVAGEILGGQHHSADHDQGQYAQRHAEVKHGQKYADYRNDRIDQLGQALADELAQGINIVGVDRHDVAVGVAVKILDGQCLHVDEQVVAQTFQGSLGDLGHGAVLDEEGQDAHAVEAGHTGDGMQQAGEIVALFGQQGQDVAVDQSLHKQGALDLSEHAEQNTAQHQDDLELVLLHHVGQDALEHLAGVLYFGAGACVAAGAHFYYFRLLCHQASPPFSSKSPEPLVWLL